MSAGRYSVVKDDGQPGYCVQRADDERILARFDDEDAAHAEAARLSARSGEEYVVPKAKPGPSASGATQPTTPLKTGA